MSGVSCSSLVDSIIQNAKILRYFEIQNNIFLNASDVLFLSFYIPNLFNSSLCFLVQGLTNVCCEVTLREDVLLNRTDWCVSKF